MRCAHCGAINAVTNPACRNCLRPLGPTETLGDRSGALRSCPACGAPNASAAETCRLCGATLTVTSPTVMAPSAGVPVHEATTAPEVTAEPLMAPVVPVELPGTGGLDIGPMTLPQCLDRAFAIFRRNLGDLLLAAAVVHVPMSMALAVIMWAQHRMNPNLSALIAGDTGAWGALWEGITSGDMQQLGGILLGENTIDAATYGVAMFANVLLYLVLWFTYPWLWGVAAVLTMQTHLGRRPDPREAWRVTRRNYWQLVAVGLVYAVAYTAGSTCLYLGLIFVMPFVVYIVPIVLFEGRGAIDAIPRAFRLVSRDYGRTVWWYAASYVVVAGIQAGLESAVDLLSRGALGVLLPEGSALPALLATSLRPLAGLVYVPLLLVFRTLMYADARSRHEALDLQVRAPAAEGV